MAFANNIFRGAALGLGTVGLALTPAPTTTAFAQSAQPQVTQVSTTSAATVTRFQAGVKSDHKIVFHYGPGITLADNAARVLERKGFPAEAYAGGQPNQIEMFVNRRPAGVFSQSDTTNMVLIAENAYRARVLGQQASNPSDIIKTARDYSQGSDNRIAILINSATSVQGSEDRLGNTLVQNLSRRHIDSAYFVIPANSNAANFVSSITYFVKGVPYGPHEFRSAMHGLEVAVRDLQQDNAAIR